MAGIDLSAKASLHTGKEIGGLLGGWINRLNLPLRRPEAGYTWLTDELGFNCFPPDASMLRFAEMLPGSIGSVPALS